MRLKNLLPYTACALVLGILRLPASATTFVLMDEGDLAAASTAVVTGWVTGVEAHPDEGTGGVNTYVTIEPTDIVAGTLPEGEIVLRERGGQVQGRVEKIFGAAEFSVGEQVMVFVSQDADGSLHTTNMAMGKYTVQSSIRGIATVSRTLGAEVMVLDRATGHLHATVAPDVVELGQFVQHIRTAASRSRRPGSHTPRVRLIPPELNGSAPYTDQSPFTYLGNPSRWFEPDAGQTVLYQIDPTGDARNGLAASRSAVDSALAAWTNVPNSSLVLADGGLLSAPLPFTGCDGGSRIVFNDPFNEITDPEGCGGVLAIGGYCSSGETRTINGTTFQRITVGKIVFNNGWEQCDLWDACDLAEVATHELGHTIGLGHSADDNATMNASAHFDGRCAALETDDIAAAQFVYPEGVSLPGPSPAPQPTATSTPVPPTATPVPTNPTGVTNDACTNATTIASVPYSGTSSTSGASISTGDPVPTCGNGGRGKSVWYRFTAPSNGTLIADTFGSNYDTILATYVGSCGSFSPVPNGCNDDASSAQSRVSLQATAGTSYYFMVTAYSGNGGTLSFHVSWQGSASTATPAPTATPQPPTPIVDRNGPTATAVPAIPTATLRPPTPTFTSAPPRQSGVVNDSAATPFDIASAPATVTFSTSAATQDASDPAPVCGNRSRSRSVWLRFTAPGNGTLTADTYGSNYDTILAAFTLSANTFAPVACNDDSGSAQSRVSFQASAGTTYYFMVTAYSNVGGSLMFHVSFQGGSGAPAPSATPTPVQRVSSPTPTWTPVQQAPIPPSNAGVTNDVCTTATTLTSVPSSSAMSTTRAAAEASMPGPTCGNRSTGRSVWYRFTAPTTATVSVNTYGSTYDTILAAYSGSCAALTPVACNDDSVGAQSRVSFQVTAGTTYYFQVTAYRNDGGPLNFQLTH